MGSLFGGPKIPDVNAQAEAKRKAEEERRRAALAKGRTSTILTSGRGIPSGDGGATMPLGQKTKTGE